MFLSSTYRLLAIFVLITTPSATVAIANRSTVQRFVSMKIFVDGELAMQASTSDNGHADADEVWNYLKNTSFTFEKGFSVDGLAADADQFTLEGNDDEKRIRIEVAYGGQVEVRAARFTLDPDSTERVWRIDGDIVDKNFEHRQITRRQAASLRNVSLPGKD